MGQKYFESGLKKILTRNSRIAKKKFYKLEKEVPTIRYISYETGIKSIQNWIPEDQKLGRWKSQCGMLEILIVGQNYFESGLKKILTRNSRNSRIAMKKFYNLEKEVPKIR